MAWAQEMKNLAAEIKSSHRDRTQYVKDVKDDTHKLIVRFQGELKEMARDLKNFLAKSEAQRRANFKATMSEITEAVAKVKRRVKRMLGDYQAERKEAAGYWVSLKKKVAAATEEAAGPVKEVS